MSTALISLPTAPLEAISAAEYHALPGVSNSRVSDYIEDVRIYYDKYISGTFEPEEPKDHFDFGSAVHDVALLGDKSGIVVYPPGTLGKGERRGTKAAEAFEAENEGKIVLKPSDYMRVMRCVKAIYDHPIAGDLLRAPGPCEHAYQYYDEALKLLLRCRPDKLCLWNGLRVVVDIKTTTNTKAKKFVKSIAEFGYHRQEYFYRRVLNAVGEKVDAFLFVAVRDKRPHLVDVYMLTDKYRQLGQDEVERALVEISDRTRANNWAPTSEQNIIALDPPNYLQYASEYSV